MSKLLKYSVLRYSPSVLSGESINLGILFSEENAGYYSFRFTRNLARIKNFDDELNREALFDLLTGIKEEVDLESSQKSFKIDRFIRFYINNYKFESPHTIVYDDLDGIVEDLYKSYFRFDLPKDKRPDKKADQRIISQLIQSTGQKTFHNKKVAGAFEESVIYDIVTDYCYIKLFDFDGKDLKRCISSAKTWAWNCNHEHEKPVYIIYRYSNEELTDESFHIIRQIFAEANCRFCSIEEGMQELQRVVS